MDREREPDASDHPVFVTVPEGDDQDSEKVARPGVVLWLGGTVPDEDELARAAAMRRHPANTRPRHLRAVS